MNQPRHGVDHGGIVIECEGAGEPARIDLEHRFRLVVPDDAVDCGVDVFVALLFVIQT